MSVAAAAIPIILEAIVELVKAGLMSRECAEALCARAPVLAPVLPRLPLASMRDALEASRRARGIATDQDEVLGPATPRAPTLADLRRHATSPSDRAVLDELVRRARA